MAAGLFNPRDDNRSTSTRPAHVSSGAGLAKWFSDALQTRLHGQDFNQIIALFRQALSAFGVADEEADDQALVKIMRAATRERLIANRTYYVRTNGSDTSDGLVDSAGGAFLTIQKAIDTVLNRVDLNGFDVDIQVADGTYTGGAQAFFPFTGKGTVAVKGNALAPANVSIAPPSTPSFWVSHNGALLVKDLQIASGGISGVIANFGGVLTLENVDVGGTSTNQISATNGGVVEFDGDWSVSAGAEAHLNATGNGVIAATGATCTLIGTPAFDYFVRAFRSGSVGMAQVTFVGAATGVRYLASGDGVVSLPEDETEASIPGDQPGLVIGGVLTAGNLNVSRRTVIAKSASYELTRNDLERIIEFTAAGNLTVPANATVPFPIGTEIRIIDAGSGTPGVVTVVAAGGVTIRSRTGLTSPGPFARGVLTKTATDVWNLAWS